MRDRSEILKEIEKLTREYFAGRAGARFIPGKTKIPLNVPSYDWQEATEAIETLLTTWVTMGKKVQRFEEMYARYIGVPHGVMVNSGSSANLLAMSVLTNPLAPQRIRPGDEVITPAVTWVTTVYPIMQVGAVPVLVDVDLESFNISVREIEKAITKKTKAIMPVHLLGNPCDIGSIMEIARRHNLIVVEDACESTGAEINGRKVGSFGDLATFSFFFSHHITTIEGGMVMTSNDDLAELVKSLRVFGWIRDLRNRDEVAEKYRDIDSRFLFTNIGYNLRPTEVSGAFGMHQIGKLDGFIEIRRENARFWTEQLREFSDYLILYEERPGTRHVWFGYPVTVKPGAPFTRQELVTFLESKALETRPVFTGNLDEQPAMRLMKYRRHGDLPNARVVQRQSFFFANHQGIGKEEREAVVKYFREFMAGVKR
ncbi:MAG TPA: DegT/DnrJ/EryC1/StrS family aminotransferase [Dehalococcoidales bacterium]|nr:MAG: hypothetical protein A2Z05_07280 [Chloroflexi bacterium RBG_16_60_22]HJX13191.1 DegT/DnrJ/EryC1/StrS family aminotransferase [Dehalococcoidales bacterium]